MLLTNRSRTVASAVIVVLLGCFAADAFAQATVAKFLGTFKEYPPRQKPGSFSIGDALSTLQTASQGK